MSTLSVAIITQDGGEVLPVTLASLVPLKDLLKEVAIVDNFSSDDTVGVIASFSKVLPIEYRLRRFDTFCDQKNYAISICKGDWILGLDDDMAINALTFLDWFNNHYFDSHPVWDFSLMYARGDLRHYCTSSSTGMPTTRLWRNNLGLKYYREVHEFLCFPGQGGEWDSIHNPRVIRNTEDICILETSMLKSDAGVRERVARYKRWAEKSRGAGISIENMAANAESLIGGRWAGAAPIPQRILDAINPECFELPLAKGFPRP